MADPPVTESDLHLLRFVLDPTDDALRHWAAWVDAVGDIDDHSGWSFSMLPAAYVRLDALGVSHPWMPRLRGVYRREWAAQQLTTDVVDRARTVLDEAGIDYLLPNERALQIVATKVVPRWGDNRFAVRWGEVGAAVDAFVAAGWNVRRPAGQSVRRRLTSLDAGVRSPNGEWIGLSDHLIPGRHGPRISERIWRSATPTGAGAAHVPSVPDLAAAFASADRSLGTVSVRCALYFDALSAASDAELHITTACDPWREIDRLVDRRLSWYESLGGSVERHPVDDHAGEHRSAGARLRHVADAVSRWNGVAGLGRALRP